MVPIIVSILVPLLLYFMNKASKRSPVAQHDGRYELRMNKMYLIIGVAGVFVGVMFLLLPILADEYSTEIFVAAGIMFLLFMGFSIPCLLWYNNHRLSFDEIEMRSKSAYGKAQSINWSNITRVSFSSFRGVIDVTDKQGNVAKAHQNLVGVSSFVAILQMKKSIYHFETELLPLKALGLSK